VRPALLLVGLLLSAPLARAEAPEASEPPGYHRGLDLAGWPVASYRSEHGWLLGAYGDLIQYGERADPYVWRVRAQSVFTPGRMHHHDLSLDCPALGGSALRLLIDLGYADLPDDRWFGLGNASAWDAAWENPASPRFRALDYTRFRLRRPYLRVQTRLALTGPLSLIHGIHVEVDVVDAAPDSLLVRDRPLGWAGSRVGMLLVGVLVDTRDSEPLPTRGTLTAMTLRGAGPFLGGTSWFAGGNWTARGWWSPLRSPSPVARLVLAGRVALDALVGDVPFGELAAFRDPFPAQGLGGSTSMRGVLRRRFVGPLKLLVNLEARWMPIRFHLWRQRFDLGGVLFTDLGRVWSRADDGGWDPARWLHASGGGGLRAAWDEHTVMRMDLGVSSEATTVDFVLGQMF